MMNLRSLVTSESTAQNRYGHEYIRRVRAASSRRFFTQPSPSGLACRLVLTLAVLLAGVNAAWGDETEIWVGNTHNVRNTIEGSKFPTDIASTDLFCIYTTDKGISTITTGWGNSVLRSGDKNIAQGSYYNTTEGRYEIPISDFVDNLVSKIIGESNLIIATGWEQYLTKVSIVSASSTVDPFINEAASGCISTNNDPGEEISRELSSKEINLSGASLTGVKYVRVYLANERGKAVNPTGLLSVKYGGTDATPAGTDAKNGFYICNGGELTKSDISITLNAGAGNFSKYRIVALLSNDLSTATPSNGTSTLTQEPKWQEEYTYSLTYPIYVKMIELTGNEVAGSECPVGENGEYRDEILTHYGYTADDTGMGQMASHWYPRWYIIDDKGNVVSLNVGTSASSGWVIAPEKENDNWKSSDWGVTDGKHATVAYNLNNGWLVKNSLCRAKIFAPSGTNIKDYSGYQFVFEVTDDYTSGTPEYSVRYIWKVLAFDGKLSSSGVEDGMTQEVDSRDAASVTVDLANGAFVHSKLAGTDKMKYARFYLTDAEGTVQEPAGKLTVNYDGGTVTTCNVTSQGYYMYIGKDTELDPTKFTVTLKAPKAYKFYKVVGVFSTAMTAILPENGNAPLQREPDWELKYTYSFTFSASTTKTYSRTMEWRRKEMKADASTTDADAEWDTSFEELSLGQCIKWYVENESGVKQPLVIGDSRQASTWSIDLGTPFVAESNVAMLKGEHAITAGKWNSNWGKPAIYAPAGVDFEAVKNYKIICEVAAANDDTATPNVKYTITMFKSYLGELKETGTTGSETIMVDNFSTSETVNLGKALTGCPGAKYARVWLTTSDGTRVDPTGILTVPGMTAYTTTGDKNVDFGYYVTNASGISLSNATLTAEAGTFDKYQVHVALSTDQPGTTEPDYDYEFTFGFKYDMKTKYKTVLYNETSHQCTPHLLGNWQEVGVDCNEGRTNLAANLYVRWYLEDKNTGSPIAMESLTGGGYTELTGTNGYYRYKFDKGEFKDKGDGTAYNPTITLPSSVSYKDVRVVCVVTTKTDTWDEPWTADPEEMQVKYVYDLRTTDDLDPATYPFVHYRGEGYRYVAEQGLTELAAARDYTKVSGTTVDKQYTWNSRTNTHEVSADKDIRQNVHTVDYYYYLNLADGQEEELLLPLQYYSGAGNDTEPCAYFRWYDYTTDVKSANLTAIGSNLVERDYGLVALHFGGHPCSSKVGVKFKAPAGFTSLTESGEILIACDVSRYLDGMDDSFTYLVHEPTISERYLFHILPASILAAKTKAKAASLSAVETRLRTKSETDEVSILENSGRIVVSTKNGTGKFSLRTKIRALNHYYVYNGSNVVAADYMQWYAYYKDNTGTWWKGTINMGDRKTQRQANYELSDISGASWAKLSGEGTTAPTIKVGDRLEMIATVGNTAAGAANELPIIWGELEIIDAPPVTLGNEPEERTSAYMRSEYNHANTLDFNDFFLIGKKKPENSFENYAKIPIEWASVRLLLSSVVRTLRY